MENVTREIQIENAEPEVVQPVLLSGFNLPYVFHPHHFFLAGEKNIASFVNGAPINADRATLEAFGEEWKKFKTFSREELQRAFDQYFDIVPKAALTQDTRILDIGCGCGRWAAMLAGKAGMIEAIDPGPAAIVAAEQLRDFKNIRVTQAGFGCMPFAPESFDFVMCLGVVHHVPDPAEALRETARMLRPGGRLLLYAYYDVSNRSFFIRTLFRFSLLLSGMISHFPKRMKFVFSDLLAFTAAGPFVLFAKLCRSVFPGKKWWQYLPLGYYADKSWRMVRNDSLDRFGTPLVHRFSKRKIEELLQQAGFREIEFSNEAPWWHVTATK